MVTTFADSDWAGCKATARSTSGGTAKIRRHWIKSWSATQHSIVINSAEAELVAMVKAGAEALGMMSMMRDLGNEDVKEASVWCDASAAIFAPCVLPLC